MRRALWLVIAAAVGAGAVAWWMSIRETEPLLDPEWAGVVRVLSGTGRFEARDGHALVGAFADPFGVAVAADGAVFVSDGVNAHRIRVISPDGAVSTLAGSEAGFADGTGVSARFNTPSGVALAADGTLYVADTANNAIRRVTPDGSVSTIAGDDLAGWRDGPASDALFNGPVGVAVDRAGRILVADTYNDRIRVITPSGTVQTLAGSTSGFADGPATAARFDTPSGVAVGREGTIYVADTGNDAIRAIAPDGDVSTVSLPFALSEPIGITVDTRGVLYIADGRGRIIEAADGSARVVAGGEPGFRDGRGSEARLRRPAGIASVAPGRLIVADTGNALVRSVQAALYGGAAAPVSPFIAPGFDLDAFRWQPLLWPLEPLEGPFEVAGTLGEARGTDGERFHSGIDVRAEQGTRVVAVREGVVQSPVSTGSFGTLNEWIRIGPITYVHLRVGRGVRGDLFDSARFVATSDEGGQLIKVRVKRGAHFLTGERIGSVNAFNHVHVNVGWPGEEYNPLLFRLVQFADSVPPTIAAVRLFDDAGQPFSRRRKGRLVVSGRVQIVVDAWDQADDSQPNRRLGLFALGYQVLRPDGSPVPGFEQPLETLRFDRMNADSGAPPLVYAPGSGIPFYGQRRTRFLYIVTNTFRDGVAQQGFWDTSALGAGDYVLRIHARDINGNQARARRDVPVTVLGPGTE